MKKLWKAYGWLLLLIPLNLTWAAYVAVFTWHRHYPLWICVLCTCGALGAMPTVEPEATPESLSSTTETETTASAPN